MPPPLRTNFHRFFWFHKLLCEHLSSGRDTKRFRGSFRYELRSRIFLYKYLIQRLNLQYLILDNDILILVFKV